MINILIVEDNNEKQYNIGTVLDEICDGRKDINILSASNIVDAKSILAKTNIDAMILDICLPMRFRDKPEKDGGIKLLKEINKSQRYNYPKYVISISQFEDSTKEFNIQDGFIHTSICYDTRTTEWSVKLKDCMNIVITILSNNVIHRNYDFDIAVICALEEELDFVKESLIGVEQLKYPDDDGIYFEGYFEEDDRKIRIVATASTQMGMVPSAVLTTRMIHNFVPRYMVMTGIAAGVDKGKVNFGDAIVATNVWDYGAGKDIREDGEVRHLNTINQEVMNPKDISKVKQLMLDSEFLHSVKKNFHGNVPNTEFKIHIGQVVSGAAVVADAQKVLEIKTGQSRDLLALEMEIYGVYHAANWSINPKPRVFAVKSICDFANEAKNDDYHKYASYTSARVFEKMARCYFEYDF
ncbi:response regulator [Clostridium botulinum]|nr:response regulator [Clostridium botulinum]NFO91328.1 response regulator [Clostridium botulinum]